MGTIVGLTFALSFVVGVWRWAHGRRAVARAERVIRSVREVIVLPMRYRLPTDRDRELVSFLRFAAHHESALAWAGFVKLGVLVLEPLGREPYGALRAYRDKSGEVIAYVTVLAVSPNRFELTFASYTADGEIRTSLGSDLARAPHLQQQVLVTRTTIAELAKRHREFATGELQRIETLEHLIECFETNHERTAAWRKTHEPDVLLELDLRAIFGPRYDQVGHDWRRRLTDELPSAILRR